MRKPLRRLRLRLTAWYVGSFAAILLVVGGGMYVVTAREIEAQLGRSLRAACAEVVRAARITAQEGVAPRQAAVDAVDEMEVPGSELYLFDAGGALLSPDTADPEIREAARAALRRGAAERSYPTTDGEWRVAARRFGLDGGGAFAVVAVADLAQTEQQSLRLIQTFGAGAFVALLLVAGMGHRLARLSVRPVEASYEQMQRFTADAAHELRTPVAVLRGRAEVALQQPRDPAAYEQALRAIGREAEAMGRIVEDLLVLARADAGMRAVAAEPVYLDDVVSDAASSAGVLAEARGVRLRVGGFEEARVTGDAALLRQLVLILLHNAVKFTPAGGEVRVDVTSGTGGARLVVEDTGTGIDAAELPRVFDRFYRGAAAREQGEGAGLGLSIARWIVDAHGGRLEVASEAGRGTRATVAFPPAHGLTAA